MRAHRTCAVSKGARHPLMTQFIVPLAAATSGDAERIGPKAANLAALDRAGLPTPGGFCLTADAYRRQVAALGLSEVLRGFGGASPAGGGGMSVEIRLALYEQPIVPEILAPLLESWRKQRQSGAP